MERLLAIGLTCLAVLWAVLLTADARPEGPAHPSVVGSLVHAAAAVVCHQRPERSFQPGGRRFPVCARCAGLYLAGAFGALAGWIGRPRVPRRGRLFLAAAALPTVITLAVEWAGLGAPSNLIRATAAVPLGAAAGWLFVTMLRADEPAVQMRYHSEV
jgi:uncharacterized membrane protein